jgi:hypothetical protein
MFVKNKETLLEMRRRVADTIQSSPLSGKLKYISLSGTIVSCDHHKLNMVDK